MKLTIIGPRYDITLLGPFQFNAYNDEMVIVASSTVLELALGGDYDEIIVDDTNNYLYLSQTDNEIVFNFDDGDTLDIFCVELNKIL